MNYPLTKYPPNRNHHRHFDLVIHDGDEKVPCMVRRVIGYTRAEGWIKTQYIDRSQKRKILRNDLAYIHLAEHFFPWIKDLSPDDTRLSSGHVQEEWERVQWFNRNYPIGTRIFTTSADGGFEDVTTHEAFMTRGGGGRVHLKRGGNWSLEFVQPILEAVGV